MGREEIKRAKQQLSIAEKMTFYAMGKRIGKEQAELFNYVKSFKEAMYIDDYFPSLILTNKSGIKDDLTPWT